MSSSAHELDQLLAQQTLSEALFALWAQREAGVDRETVEAAREEASDSSLMAHLVGKGALQLSAAMETAEDPEGVQCRGCKAAYEVGALLLTLLDEVPCPRCGSPLEEEVTRDGSLSATTPPGAKRTVGGYVIQRSLGRGGMAEVFLAEGPDGERVALKVLSPKGADPSADRRFDREGRVLQQLAHPNIVSTLGSGVDETSGRPFIVLELAEGENLFKLLRSRDSQRLTVPEAAYVLSRCAAALEHAHEQGIYHRDLKPANVIVTTEGDVKLTDFGIATTASTLRITATNEVVGTLGFVCPEALGPGTLEWTSSNDLYALGALAYRLIAGRNAFSGSSLRQVLEAQREDGFLALREFDPEVPEELSNLVGGLLAANPERRPPMSTVRSVLASLDPEPSALTELRAEVAAILKRRAPQHAQAGEQALNAGEVFENYRIEEEVGRGGMGVVYRAHHLTLNKSVALKVMLKGALASEDDRARFLREAESAGRLQHPNIVPVLDAGVGRDGLCFLTMEFVQGDSLSNWLEERGASTALRVFTRICAAVQHAHSRGVIHRDLKPSNMLVDRVGEPRVLDFGIAKRVEETEDEGERKTTTGDGSIVGTLAYMPPEQAGGKAGDVDVRSDVYALGTILYEFLCGSTPFHGNAREMLKQIHFEDPQPPSSRDPEIPWELDAICLKALEKERDDRYQSALELKRDVERYLEGVPIRARRAGGIYRLRKWVQRNRGLAAIGAISLTVIGALLIGIVSYALKTERERRAAVVAEVVGGWQQFEEGAFSEAARSFDRARSQLEPDDLLVLPEGARDYLPGEVVEDLSPRERSQPRVHHDRLEAWIAYVEAQREFERARVLLQRVDRCLEAGDLGGADAAIKEALVLRPDAELVRQAATRVSASLSEDGRRLLDSAAQLPETAFTERARLLEEARARMRRAQELDSADADALSGLIEAHRELSKLSEASQAAAERAEAKRRADELVALARSERRRGKADVIRQALPEVVRRRYLGAIQNLQQALFLVQGHPDATQELRSVAAELSAILVAQGQPELAEFIRQLGGVDAKTGGRAKVPTDPYLPIVESAAALIRNKFGRDVHFKPTRVFDRQREIVKKRGGDRYRIVMQVRSRIVGGGSHLQILATGVSLRIEDRVLNTIGPPVHINFRGGPWVRRVAVDSHGRRLVGPFTDCPGFDVPRVVMRVDTAIKDLLRKVGR